MSARIDTSGIDKKPFISEYEKRFGVGESMNKGMTYSLLKFIIIGIFAVLGATLLGGLIMSIKGDIEFAMLLKPLEVCINIFGAITMALIGYFIGRKVET